ncbi:MAG TPA: MarR family transcriptional regulator [Candidatus Dormibacteraeota bacterium]|nr:MarR family transcriptional regulator [Candidatus Dormibacteraeota bacterium]
MAVSRFIEGFASVLTEGGFPRMPARVFAALLATDSGRLTAAELAALLQASPAAISSAVAYLVPLTLVAREREPGSRRDLYRIHDDVWYESVVRREQVMLRWEASLGDGIAALGGGSPAGRRLAETLAFLRFVHGELPDLLRRWRERRDHARALDRRGPSGAPWAGDEEMVERASDERTPR